MTDWVRARALTLFGAAMIALGVTVAGCEARQWTAPVSIADRTTLDESKAIQVEAMYQAFAQTVIAADRFGLVPAAARPAIAKADLRAYYAVQAVRRAYNAGNAVNYDRAADEADAAVKAALAAFRG